MEQYYIIYSDFQKSFHYESKQEYESKPKNGYEIIEKCFSLEEASRKTHQLTKNLKNELNI